ncbi:PRC-barrel domain-containing protein [Deinococcus sp. AJ005]|uniref:PRC-barrel domain-containing protein n=1 Tax=Deinococcus sp. AJ005 TaxID=2652443 RepID=UPI00125CB948|nr:PRC-barrel domain-containing protein [Deinococcus sp. AJ005]QFP78116.1 photosystem reaction center subunit H [Deinococcus sp. AJ005]
MIKGKDILGRHIVAIDSGQRIDNVHDLIFDHQANEVLGLLVDEGGWFRAAKVVPFEMIRSIGEDAIMIDSADHVTTTRDDDRLADVLDSKISLIGMTLLTTDGQDLGKIADVYFDEKTGKVEGYEATGGLFSDLSNGRTFVPAPENVQIGEHAAIVPVSVAAAMQEQEPGGIKGAFSSASDSIKGAYENVADATKERQKEYAVGKHAGGDITLEDGTVIVAKGDTITAEQADLAEQHGKLGALATTATGGVISDAYGNIADATRERQKEYAVGKTAGGDVTLEDGTVIVAKGDTITTAQADLAEQHGKLGALATTATGGSISDAYGNIADASRERQKEYVIGKAAGGDLLAEDGSTIVTKGQIITAEQADRAEQDGKLTMLATTATGGVIVASYGNARDRVQGGFDDMRDATAERQKTYVVGKTASQDVSTDAGETIVYKGGVITEYQAERAEQVGKLGALTAAATGGAIAGGLRGSGDTAVAVDPSSPEAAIGRRAKTEVRSPSGSLVAAQGQIVTAAILERAQHLGVQDQLLAATVGRPAQASGTDTRAALAGGLENVSSGASNLFERARGWLGERREDAETALDERQQAAHEQRIKDALGRPVNRVILAPDDSIILNLGEIVTHKAVELATGGDVLDILLDSVSMETPDINPMNSRPAEHGKGALDSQPDLGKQNTPDTDLKTQG